MLTPTNLKPNLTPPQWQLGSTIYRLTTGCSCNTLAAFFSLSVPFVNEFFSKICRVLVSKLYGQYVRLSKTEAEWGADVKGFLEDCELPCVGAWDIFHVYVNSNLENYFNFKKRYSVTYLGSVGFNKYFLYVAVGASGSTHDARLSKEFSLYTAVLDRDVMLSRCSGRFHLLLLETAPCLNMHDCLKYITRTRGINRKTILTKGFVEQGKLQRTCAKY